MHIPEPFWSDVFTACYLINQMTSSILDVVSPHSLLFYSSSPVLLVAKGF